jgi:DAK2 domain fusion protein YloV
VLDCLDGAVIRRWCAAGLAGMRRHQREIDELNVYPVPDGDTGTNLVLTLTSAWDSLAATPDAPVGGEGGPTGLGMALRGMARGALFGARGNSGVIISQLIRGIADTMANAPLARGRLLADALRVAADAGYAAVTDPVEGTILTVARAAATGAAGAGSDKLEPVVRAAADAARAALARTPEQLPALARAGVVDAGGRGLVVLLDALVEVVTGVSPDVDADPATAARPAGAPRPLLVPRETGSMGFAYEVQYLLDASADAVSRLRTVLSGLGDSLVVVGMAGPDAAAADGAPTWNVHVHVNDVGAAIEAGVEAGRPHRISVTRFEDQVAQLDVSLTVDAAARAVVVVAGGLGLARLFAGEGAAVVAGTQKPSTAEVLAAIRGTRAGSVVLLPNDSNVTAVASAAADEARADGIEVHVVPTRSPVQALAALAVRDPGRRFADDVIAMAEAAGACRWAEVTVASRESLTVAGRCLPGDILGLVEGEVNVIGQDIVGTCVTMLDRMLNGGGELVTLITGAQAPPDLTARLTRHLGAEWPFVEIQAYEGGQPHYPLLVGVE